MVVGGLAFYASSVFLLDTLPAGTPVPIAVFTIIALVAAIGHVSIGVAVLRGLGIPFLAKERTRAE